MVGRKGVGVSCLGPLLLCVDRFVRLLVDSVTRVIYDGSMMIDDYSSPRDLSYGLTPDQLSFDSIVLERAPECDAWEHVCYVTNSDYVRNDPDAANRTLNMALALYEKILTDPDNAFKRLGRIDLFGACLDQAVVWEVG